MSADDFVFDPTAKPTRKVPPPGNGEQQHADFTFDPANKPGALAKHIMQSVDPQSGLVKAWSPSVLKKFETCRYRVYLEKVAKYAEPSNAALERGIAYHSACEEYVNGTLSEFPADMAKAKNFQKFTDDFSYLREQYAEAKVDLEGEWAFNTDWQPVDWRSSDAWARMKLDALHWMDETCAKVIDYKTGKKFGNEMAHADQGMQYTIAAFMRHEQLEMLQVEFWYLDTGEKSFPQRYSRTQANLFMPRITERAIKLTTAQTDDFRPSPSVYTCKICPYNRDIEGCQWRFRG